MASEILVQLIEEQRADFFVVFNTLFKKPSTPDKNESKHKAETSSSVKPEVDIFQWRIEN